MKAVRAVAAILGLGVLLLGVGGCSRDGPALLTVPLDDDSWPATLPPPPEEAERAKWRALGVALAPLAPEIGFQTWIRGGMAEGATRGTMEGLMMGTIGGAYAGLVGVVVFAPLGAVVGGVGGATSAVPDETAEEIDAFVRACFDGESFGAALRERLVRRAGEETSFAVTAVDLDQDAGDGASCAVDPQLTTLLQLSVTGYGFFGGGSGGEDPSLRVVLAVQGRIIDTATCGEGHSIWLAYTGKSSKYSEWRAGVDGALQEEIRHGTEVLAEKMIEELFLLYLPKEARGENGRAVADGGHAAVTPGV
jgi:hypothetical protein